MSVFLAENTNGDGTITDEEVFCEAAATLFLGKCLQSPVTIANSHFPFGGGVDTVSPTPLRSTIIC